MKTRRTSENPESVENDRQLRQKLQDHKHQAQPVMDAFKDRVETETGKVWDWGKELWVSYISDRSFVGFDVWYGFDDARKANCQRGLFAVQVSRTVADTSYLRMRRSWF